MFYISATRLRLKSIFILPGFFAAAPAIDAALRNAPGFVGGKELMDKGMVFWTVTSWHSASEMLQFRNSPAHRQAMRKLPDWCSEASIAHWEQESPELPDWATTHHKITKEGITSKVRNPSVNHINRSFPLPRWTKTERTF